MDSYNSIYQKVYFLGTKEKNPWIYLHTLMNRQGCSIFFQHLRKLHLWRSYSCKDLKETQKLFISCIYEQKDLNVYIYGSLKMGNFTREFAIESGRTVQ